MKNTKKILAVMLVVALVATLGLALVACGNKGGGDTQQTVTVVMPDGTPVLSVARMFTDNAKIDGKNMQYQIVSAQEIVGKMKAESADIVIMPINQGVNAIVKNNVGYKLASVNVEGSLYVVGKPNGGSATITLDNLKGKTVACIGQGAIPDLIFKYIVSKNDGLAIGDGADNIHIKYVSDASQALSMLSKETPEADFALVGEPAATAPFGVKGFTARLDLQTEFKKASGLDNFPQAAMFVKNSLFANATFMAEFKAAQTASANWVNTKPEEVTAYMLSLKDKGALAGFPKPSVLRCNIVAKYADNKATQDWILNSLKLINIEVGSANIFA
ncbi:MAG: hypothetical protein RSB59_06190 [Clostridia bacterium]